MRCPNVLIPDPVEGKEPFHCPEHFGSFEKIQSEGHHGAQLGLGGQSQMFAPPQLRGLLGQTTEYKIYLLHGVVTLVQVYGPQL